MMAVVLGIDEGESAPNRLDRPLSHRNAFSIVEEPLLGKNSSFKRS